MGIVVKGGPRRGLALSSSPRRHILAKRGLAFSLVRLDKRKPPLNVYRNKKNGSFGQFTRQVSRRANEGKVSPPVTPCNIYVGENFSVRLQRYFYFLKLMEDNSHGGLVHNNFHPHRKLKEMTLSRAAIRLATVPNAGGNSVLSEVISFEFFRSCFNAKLLKTEMEVDYYPMGGSITDYVCGMFGRKFGVSVTRAMKYMGEFTDEDAERLLSKKLKGVVQSSKNSLENWEKQILHVWTPSKDTANTLTRVYNTLDNDVTSNTVVIVTVAHNSKYIFRNH